jgi:hypothetical protein
MNTVIKFGVRYKDVGYVLHECNSEIEAQQKLNEYEEIDKLNGIYTPDFYEVFTKPNTLSYFPNIKAILFVNLGVLSLIPSIIIDDFFISILSLTSFFYFIIKGLKHEILNQRDFYFDEE